MINIEEFKYLFDCKSKLKETSLNDSGNKYMSESTIDVINFDKVKGKYIGDIKVEMTPSSNDALLVLADELIFIEFKDGNMKDEIHNVRRKNFESLLILLDIINKTITELPPIKPHKKIRTKL